MFTSRKVRNLLLIINIIWMMVIFSFSAQPAKESTETSLKVGTMVGKVIKPGFSDLPKKEQIRFAKKIEFPVRKLAHATEYAILGALMSLFFFSWNRKRHGLYGWLWGILYAITDELHQSFVPGRSCQMTDVAIDSLGCLFGCTVIALLMSIRRKRWKKG